MEQALLIVDKNMQSRLIIDKKNLLKISLTEIYLYWYPFHSLPVELWEISCKSTSFLLTENIKRDNQGYGIIYLFNSNIPTHFFLQDKHNINAMSKNIKFYVYSAQNWVKAQWTFFCPSF
jgi:hypothetical protein